MRWAEGFFRDTLPAFASLGMISKNGSIWLPHAHYVEQMLEKYDYFFPSILFITLSRTAALSFSFHDSPKISLLSSDSPTLTIGTRTSWLGTFSGS